MAEFLGIETERLYLRPLKDEDAESMIEYHSDPDVVRWRFIGYCQSDDGHATEADHGQGTGDFPGHRYHLQWLGCQPQFFRG